MAPPDRNGKRGMTQETIAIIGAAIVLAGLNLYLARGLNEVRRDIADLRERMARLEGLFDGFVKRGGGAPDAA